MTVRCSRRQLLTELLAAVLALFGFVASVKATTRGESQARNTDPRSAAFPGWEPQAATYSYEGGAIGSVSGAALGTPICYVYRPDQGDRTGE